MLAAAVEAGGVSTPESGGSRVNIEILVVNHVGQQELDRMVEGVLSVFVSPGGRFVQVESRGANQRLVGTRITVAMKLRVHRTDADFEACEELTESIEEWLTERSNSSVIEGAVFSDLLDTAATRQPFDRELMEETPQIYAAAIDVEYERSAA